MLTQNQNGDKPMSESSEGSNSNGGKSVAEGERASVKSFRAKFMTNEDVNEGQTNQTSEMDHLHVEYNVLSEAIKNNMTFSE